jgi:hypothetical protein
MPDKASLAVPLMVIVAVAVLVALAGELIATVGATLSCKLDTTAL